MTSWPLRSRICTASTLLPEIAQAAPPPSLHISSGPAPISLGSSEQATPACIRVNLHPRCDDLIPVQQRSKLSRALPFTRDPHKWLFGFVSILSSRTTARSLRLRQLTHSNGFDTARRTAGGPPARSGGHKDVGVCMVPFVRRASCAKL